MAVLVRRWLLPLCAALGLAGCSVVDPLVIPENYTVQHEDQAKIAVRIEGGDGVSRLAVRDVIHDYMIDLSKDPDRDAAAFDAMLEIENLFELNGFPMVEVKYRIEREPGIRVVFTIAQHNQVVLEECRIQGGPIPAEDLLVYLPRRKSEVLGLGEDLYVTADIETLRQGILNHYQREGYLDATAEIQALEPALTRQTKRVKVTLRVDAKALYRVGAIALGDNLTAIFAANERTRQADPDAGPALPAAALQTGKPFRGRDLQDYGLALRSYLRRWGYPDPKIRTTVTPHTPPSEQANTVSISVQAEPGEAVIVERVDIEGRGFASESNIRERIMIRAGARFDGAKEEATVLRLYRSGLFRIVETEYRPAGPGRIIVVFKVQETTRYLVQPLIGSGSYERIRGGLEFEMLSLLGTDFDFNSTAIISDRGHRVVASIVDSEFWPSLFGLDTAFTVSLDDFKREEPSYTDGATGISPAISKLFTREISTRVAYLLRDHGDSTSDVIDPGAQIGDYREGSMVFELAYDSRDNPVMPQRGLRVALQHKWADDSLASEVSFRRTRLSATQVLELGQQVRFALRAEGGILEPESTMDTVPIQERFFNGGETTVRSFREDQLASLDLRDINGKVIGGGFRNVFSSELRWAPQLTVLRAFDLEFALFGDAGNLGREADDYGLRDMKYAVGAGIRFLLPIGPVRFDYAHNPDREPGERDWTFHFSIGYPF